MEPQQQLAAATDHHHHQEGGCSGAGKPSNYLCRQSNTRWTPTTDQIRILKDLYYNNGIRSPTTDQIQKISARLRQYGKIEGKNVFYWFQNHKARERQKKRFTAATTTTTTADYADHHFSLQKGYPNFSPAGVYYPSSSATGVVPAGQMVGGCGYYEHLSMESNPRECVMSPCGNEGLYSSFPSQGKFQWNGMDPYNYPASFSFTERSISDEDEGQDEGSELETLPLFPMHGEDYPVKAEAESYYGATGCHWFNATDAVSTRTSLELSLNSCGDQWPKF